VLGISCFVVLRFLTESANSKNFQDWFRERFPNNKRPDIHLRLVHTMDLNHSQESAASAINMILDRSYNKLLLCLAAMDFNFSSEFISLIFDNKPFFNQKDLTCLEAYFLGGLEGFKISAEIDEFVVEELDSIIDPIEYIPEEFKELYREEKLKINLSKSPQEQLEEKAFKAQQYRAKLKQTARINQAAEEEETGPSTTSSGLRPSSS